MSDGSTWIPNEAIHDVSVPVRVRFTFCLLLMHRDADNLIRVSVPTLAQTAGCSEQSILGYLHHLEQIGWIRSRSEGTGDNFAYETPLWEAGPGLR